MVYLTRKEHFNAAHRLHNPEWSDEKNRDVFGKCNNENWHGHNFELYITVKGEPEPETGFVYNAKELSKIIKERVVDKLDHKNLNLDVDFMQGIIPSTENLAKAIWQQLEPALENCELHCVQLWETDRIYVEYYGT
jgi:6-pyruvoyltetrahydropterin/6-carboxytetrahydropterin synthase